MENLKNYYILYFDVLGYKSLVENGEDEYLIDRIQHIIKTNALLGKNIFKSKLYTYSFSDNFLLAIDDSSFYDLALFIASIELIQLDLFVSGIIVRGGLIKGPLLVKKNFIYGKGLIDAYNIENSIAKYPRIVFDKNLITEIRHIKKELIHYKKTVAKNELSETTYKTLLFAIDCLHFQKDSDGHFFIDYLDGIKAFDGFDIEYNAPEKTVLLAVHSALIEKRLNEFKNNKNIFEKYMWCCEYHNKFCVKHNYVDMMFYHIAH